MITTTAVKWLAIGAVAFAAGGSFLAPPVQQAIAAVIATDVQCTGCVGSSDVAGNAITAAKIKDNEVKAAEIATDAVGAAEIQGVTKLLFGECNPTASEESLSIDPGFGIAIECAIASVDADDSAIATYRPGSECFYVSSAEALDTSSDSKGVSVLLKNDCMTSQKMGSDARVAVIVYDK